MASEAVPLTADVPQSEARVPRHLGLALVVIAAAQLMIVLDATIVNVALPHIQRALGFSGSGLEWIVTAYSLAFGGLLLLGGRLGDILGRRRVFIIGVSVFSLGSLLGGFATSEWWLLAARALQGSGAALAAPTALALIATTFPQGAPRNKALGVYAGMSGAGGAVGLLAGRHPDHVRVLALGALRQRADRPPRDRPRADRPGAIGAPAQPPRHPRCAHECRGAWPARVRSDARGRRPRRRVALGQPGHDRRLCSRPPFCS